MQTLRPGIIVVDKPRGPSSHQVAAWVGRLCGMPVGHSGTLDPGVSGVLVVMLGNAVRLTPILHRDDKEYVCLLRLHGDATVPDIEQAVASFIGKIYQRPPRRSAVKRSLRIRTIHRIDILGINGRLVLFRVKCDSGTYVRSLCHHIGLALGTGGHMAELRRTRAGIFSEKDAHKLHEIADASECAKNGDVGPLSAMILPPSTVSGRLQRVVLRDSAVDAICHGAAVAGVGVVMRGTFRAGDEVAVYSRDDRLVCLAEAILDSSSWQPGTPGLVLAPRTVFMAPGTYPKGWKGGHQTRDRQGHNL